MSRKDPNERNRVKDSDNRMLHCAACGQFFPAQDGIGELVRASAEGGGQCPDCGGDRVEQVVLDPNTSERQPFSKAKPP